MTTGRDWGGLRGILDEAQGLDEAERGKPPVDCPICGNRLDINSRGERNCDVGHYRSTAAGT